MKWKPVGYSRNGPLEGGSRRNVSRSIGGRGGSRQPIEGVSLAS